LHKQVTHTQRHMNNAWSEMVFSTPCLALYSSWSPWLVQTIWDTSSPTTDQPCRLITTLLLLVLHFYDYEQPNAPLPTNLTTIPEGLGNLSSLTSLNLSYCTSLTTIPEGLGNLSSLTRLNLMDCTSLTTIPEGLGNLSSLTRLNLMDCTSLTMIPEGLRNLSSLATLNLRGCRSLTTIPNGLGT
jgi:hypothetical protein